MSWRVVVYSCVLHYNALNEVLCTCMCTFLSKHCLGHVVNSKGVSVDPDKTERVRSWPTPANAGQLRSFLGLVSYYRRFVRNFAKIAENLHALTGKAQSKAGKANTPFVWSAEADLAFCTLKKALCEALVLSYPCFERDFVLETDASGKGLGACLCQADDQGQLHPVAYASRGLRGAEKNYSDMSSFKLEFLALKWAVSEQFRDYLLGHHTIVWTDHNPLSHLQTAKLGATEQRWMAQLAPFDLEIKYRSGKSNKCADALSRYPHTATGEVSDMRQWSLCVEGTPVPVQIRSTHVSEASSQKSCPEESKEPNGSRPTVFPSFSHSELASFQQEDDALKVVLS